MATAKKVSLSEIKSALKTLRVAQVPGLYVCVSKSSNGNISRSYAIRYSFNGKNYKHSIGTISRVSYELAKKIALEANARLVLGEDPFPKSEIANSTEKKKTLTKSPYTVEKLIIDWVNLEDKRGRWKNCTRSQAETILGWVRNHLSDDFRKQRASKTKPEQVAGELYELWMSCTSTPEKLLGVLSQAFDWGIRHRKVRITSNPADPQTVKEFLPASHKRPKPVHHPYLAPEQMPEFIAQLSRCNSEAAHCLMFQIFTVLRINNARLAQWSHIDLEDNILTIPRDAMKTEFVNSPNHIVPLSNEVIKILQRLPRFFKENWELNDYLFASFSSSQHSPVTEQSIYKTIRTLSDARKKEAKEGWHDPSAKNRLGLPRIVVPHGLARTSFETWALDPVTFNHPEYSVVAIDYIMDHQLDKYRGAYKRRPPIGVMRQILEDWSNFCCSKISKKTENELKQ